MVSRPILPDPAFDAHRAMLEAGMTHRGKIVSLTEALQTNREVLTTVVTSDPIPGKLVAPNARDVELAAATGQQVRWVWKTRQCDAIAVGSLVEVTDEARGWTRRVRIDLDLTAQTGRLQNRYAVSDVGVT